MRRKAFEPVCVYDPTGLFTYRWIAAERSGEEVTILMSDVTRPYVFTRVALIGQIGTIGTRYITSEMTVEKAAEFLRQRALQYGATPEAIRLLGQFSPFTKKEKDEMAEKLKSGNAAGLKAAAKGTPVGGGAKSAPAPKKGNPEALAKAREAGAAAREELKKDKRKITLTDKGAEKVKKGGDSSAVANLVAMKAAKTVGGAITNGLSMADLNYAQRSGTIEIG